MQYVVGAYPAAPATDPWDAGEEAEFLGTLLASPLLGGLELPFNGVGLHRADEGWLFDHLPAEGQHVLTAVPLTVARTQADRAYGLAAPDEQGRRAALADIAGLRDAVERLVQHQGRAAVTAVELQTAPPGTEQGPAGSATALAASLTELAGWDWCGARILIEHCDAAGTFPPQKGYLSLGTEIEAIKQVAAGIGITINWGRSAIERHDIAAAPEHIATAAEAGLLGGLIFSGVGADPDAPFGAWADAHLQPAPLEPMSLLDQDGMALALRAAGSDLDYLGIKLIARGTDRTAKERAGGLCRSLELLDAARQG